MQQEKNRKLSEKEQRRLAAFEATCERYLQQGYKRTDLTIGIVKANLLAFKKQNESTKVLIYDHPTQAGSVIFEKQVPPKKPLKRKKPALKPPCPFQNSFYLCSFDFCKLQVT
ncbi:MAG: hypothetical protein IJL44_02400 [Bacteroidales bacterium]|nr:hypothetical protein [Bacteroidales bacterium]